MNNSDHLTAAAVGEEEALSPTVLGRARQLAQIFASLTLLLGILALIGWAFDIETLKTVWPGFVSMKVNTALCFIFTSTALLLGHLTQPRPWKKSCSLALLILVIIISGATLSEFFTGQSFGIDQLFIQDHLPPQVKWPPGRMGGNAAITFLLDAFAVICLSRGTRGAVIAQALVVAGLFLTLLTIIGYLFGAQILLAVCFPFPAWPSIRWPASSCSA